MSGKRVDPTPTAVAGWRQRAVAAGWVPGTAKFADLIAFEERLSIVETERLRGVRVKTNGLQAWWDDEAHFSGIGRDGAVHVHVVAMTNGTAIAHIPPAESFVVTNAPPTRGWCACHVFACQPTGHDVCGWTCQNTRECLCSVCLYAASHGGTALERLGALPVYPLPKHAKMPPAPPREHRPLVRPAAPPKAAKVEKPKDKKWLPGQLGLLDTCPSR